MTLNTLENIGVRFFYLAPIITFILFFPSFGMMRNNKNEIKF